MHATARVSNSGLIRALTGAFLCWTMFSSQSIALVVCREKAVAGMDAQKERADEILRTRGAAKTSNAREAMVYAEYAKGVLYYQSNFHSLDDDGKPEEFATKIAGAITPAQAEAQARETIEIKAALRALKAGKQPPSKASLALEEDAAAREAVQQIPYLKDAATVFKTIVYAGDFSSAQASVADHALNSSVRFILDKSMFDENGIPRINLIGAKNIEVVDSTTGASLSTDAELLETSKPPPSLIAKIKGCCLYGRPPQATGAFSAGLDKIKVTARDVMVASLFVESATEDALDSSKTIRAARVKGDGAALNSEADLRKIFVSAKGKVLVLLGHVEGEDYVVRPKGSNAQLSVPILKVRALAKEQGVSLIDIGCETTKAIKEAAFGLGITRRYNSVDAVQSLEKALGNTTSLRDLLEGMSSEGLKVVVDETFVRDQPSSSTRASIFALARNKGRAVWIRVARLTASFVS